MSHKHDHTECDHQLKYCTVCKVPYCTVCGKEWHNYNYSWAYQPYTTYVSSYNNNPALLQAVKKATLTTSCCTHDSGK